MNTRMQKQSWISRTLAVLGLIVVASVAGIVILMITGQPVPGLIVTLGAVAAGGLVKLWISPLNRELLE